MEALRVELAERSYEIAIGSGSLGSIGDAVSGLGDVSPRLALISNPTVFELYGKTVEKSLKSAGFQTATITVPDGEQYKDLLWVEKIYGELLKHKLDRKSVIVALGGGVIGDMAGFAASTYMRGIRFVQVPTTLLAQVDSSVGGKTGVNHPLGKNMIGAFWQPSLVWMDLRVLSTLPEREFKAGLSEVIKYGVIWDREFFDFLMEAKDKALSLEAEALTRIIRRSCEIKAEVVSRDEREGGLRAILNYGHTMGHAIETLTGYTKHLHGEAVSMGMYLEALLSEQLGIMKKGGTEEVHTLIDAYGLPSALSDGLDTDAMLGAMAVDKKTVGGQLRFVLPEEIGKVKVSEPVSEEDVRSFLDSL
jgi:3-dehydroquinate synthase